MWAVVKAHGYGLQLPMVIEALAHADGLAVLDLSEAQSLRDLGWRRPILLLEGAFQPDDLAQAVELDLDVVVHAPHQMSWMLDRLDSAAPLPTRIWIKLNTGMNRLGFREPDWPSLRPLLAELRGAGHPLGFITHFADAEHPETLAEPMDRFHRGLEVLSAQPNDALGVANSAGCLQAPGLLDPDRPGKVWSRAGIALYGAGGFDGLRPATRLVSEVIAVQEVEAGERVGYGGIWTASQKSRIAVVAAGYADGLPRGLPQGLAVRVDGGLAPLVGRVSMDMLTLDITGLPQAGVGSAVELWGPASSIDALAAACGTIAYELLTAVSARVPRRLIP